MYTNTNSLNFSVPYYTLFVYRIYMCALTQVLLVPSQQQVQVGHHIDVVGDSVGGVAVVIVAVAIVEVVAISMRENCQDRFSSTILLGGPGMQGTNEEVSPDTSRC